MGKLKIIFLSVVSFLTILVFYAMISGVENNFPQVQRPPNLSSWLRPFESIESNNNNNNSTFKNGTISILQIQQKDNNMLKVDSRNDKERKSIFFMETSGKPNVTSRQACALESAARKNQDMNIILYFLSTKFELNSPFVTKLSEIANIQFTHLDLEKFFQETPLHMWYKKGDWKTSPYRVSHLSDALRFLTLWKFGGIYLDLDVVVIKSLSGLKNCAGKEDKEFVACGVMAFDQGHDFLADCLAEFDSTYKAKNWGWNGPLLITRVLKRYCDGIISLDEVSRKNCKGVTALPPSAFYAVNWKNWKKFFNADKSEETIKLWKESYLVHVWNKHSSQTPIKIGLGQPYELVAKENCPSVYLESVAKGSF